MTNNIDSVFLKGFSLLEMAVVLGVLGVLLAWGLASLPEKRTVTNQLSSLAAQENIKKQLMAFALINKYLPCPDSDNPPNGREDRVGNACQNDFGAVPYLDMGLNRDQVQDSYGNFIRYAINQNADVGAFICDNTSSASYFCNTGGGAVFTLVDTPPLQGNLGVGNYFVCNNNAAACTGGTGIPANNDLQTASASVVLVAYNEDGAQTLNNCAGSNGASAENCDTDEFYHQRTISTAENDFFDDTIVFISGYEIKARILSPITVWINITTLDPTYARYNLDAGDYVPMDDVNTPDVIRVNHNITTALDLEAGDDQVIVGNDLSSELIYDNNTGNVTDKGTQAALDTGEGDDTVYIVGVANSNVTLGYGDDTFVLGTNLTETLDAGSGNDKIWIQGGVASGATFELGAGDDVVWLGDASDTASGSLLSDVNGGADYDILILENMTKTEWLADGIFQSYVVNFELVMFSDDGTGTREYIVLP